MNLTVNVHSSRESVVIPPAHTSKVTTVSLGASRGFSTTLGAIKRLSQSPPKDVIVPENDTEPLPDSTVIVLEPSHTRTSIF